MIKHTLMAAAVAAALAGSGTAAAVTDAELKELREQVQQMKREYERRIDALEQRLKQAEAAAKAQASAGQGAAAEGKAEAAVSGSQAMAVSPETAATAAGARPAGANAFNPAVSLILNGVLANLSQDPARHQITGFTPTGGEVGPGDRGLSLGDSELVFSASVDPNFRGRLIAALAADNSVSVEEAYIQGIGLGQGLGFKAGRFLSSTGYLNELHPHAWDFYDAPLANKVFLGNQLADDGVQLKWVAPTDTFFELGAEIGRGRNFPGSNRDKNGAGASNLFAHLGGDIGASWAWRTGLSYLSTTAQNRSYDDLDSTGMQVNNSFDGTSRLWVLDGVLKWAPNGNPASSNFKLQGEYFRRQENGSLAYDTASVSRGTQSGSYYAAQSGWYAQGVYQFMPRWRAGYRYDRLDSGSVKLGLVDSGALAAADFPIYAAHNATRNTLMFDFSPSEFSRLRLQFAGDKSRLGYTDNQVFLQYIMSLGAHGAHKF